LAVYPEGVTLRRFHDGLDELRAQLKESGAEIEDQPQLEGFRRFHAFDPFGNRLEFLEPAR
jgi:hypothetical protein